MQVQISFFFYQESHNQLKSHDILCKVLDLVDVVQVACINSCGKTQSWHEYSMSFSIRPLLMDPRVCTTGSLTKAGDALNEK